MPSPVAVKDYAAGEALLSTTVEDSTAVGDSAAVGTDREVGENRADTPKPLLPNPLFL